MSRAPLWLLAAVAVGAVADISAEPLGDPMRPSYVKPAPKALRQGSKGYRLQAIFGDRNERVAVVNGQVVQRGDRIGVALVRSIGVDHVEMQHGARRWIERLPAIARE